MAAIDERQPGSRDQAEDRLFDVLDRQHRVRRPEDSDRRAPRLGSDVGDRRPGKHLEGRPEHFLGCRCDGLQVLLDQLLAWQDLEERHEELAHLFRVRGTRKPLRADLSREWHLGRGAWRNEDLSDDPLRPCRGDVLSELPRHAESNENESFGFRLVGDREHVFCKSFAVEASGRVAGSSVSSVINEDGPVSGEIQVTEQLVPVLRVPAPTMKEHEGAWPGSDGAIGDIDAVIGANGGHRASMRHVVAQDGQPGDDLPRGVVTLLFTDIEGSTLLLRALGDSFTGLRADHHRLLRAASAEHGGVEVDTAGDAFFVAFGSPRDALDAALAAQRALAAHAWAGGATVRVRMALHTGEPTHVARGYVGLDVVRGARICAAAHGGQVLISSATQQLIDPALQPGVTFRDLGEHRLKDLPRAEHLYQVVTADLLSDFPPLRSLETPTNLPDTATPLVGREREIVDVLGRLESSDVRLLTLTGPGGTGKTRLALAVARAATPGHPDGVYFVPLALINDPNLVTASIAESLHVAERAGRQLLDGVKDFLDTKRLLLVIDNFEQVIDAAPVISELLEAAPPIKLLVTSRAPLHLAAEIEYPVPSLVEDEAIALFEKRARSVKHDFALTGQNHAAVAEICRRLDGLPLGVELAAARTKLMAPEMILRRLEDRLGLLTGGPRDVPARQRSLRGAMDWSYELLTADEKTLFATLAVFVGPFSINAAVAVCGRVEADAWDSVGSLVDKSLLRREDEQGSIRFAMLQTIREYASERLVESGIADEVRRGHAYHFVDEAERSEPALRGPGQAETLAELLRDYDDLRAAMTWSAETGEAEAGLRIGGALWRFWQIRGYYSEGRALLARLLALPAAAPRSPATVRARSSAARLALYQGDYEIADSVFVECVAIQREMNDREGAAFSLANRSMVAEARGDYDAARSLLRDALVEAQAVDASWIVATGKYRLGWVEFLRGEHRAARALCDESLAMLRQLGDERGVALGLSYAGLVAHAQGDDAAATEYLEESVAVGRALGDRGWLPRSLANLADVRRDLGELATARTLYEEALAAWRDIGDRAGAAAALAGLTAVATARNVEAAHDRRRNR